MAAGAQIAVEGRWVDLDSAPILTASQFLLQLELANGRPDSIILSIGQTSPPVLSGTIAEQQEAVNQMRTVNVRCIARYGVTVAKLGELITALSGMQDVLKQIDTAPDQSEARV